jgi:hypothetical protein
MGFILLGLERKQKARPLQQADNGGTQAAYRADEPLAGDGGNNRLCNEQRRTTA